MEAFFTELLKQYGLPGGGMLGLGWLFFSERREHKATKKEHNEDLRLVLPAIVESTASIKALTEVVKDRGR